jgi:uncharacterized protein
MTSSSADVPVPAAWRAVDVFDFARHGRQLAGDLPVAALPRMLSDVPADAPAAGAVRFTLSGETRPEPGDDGRPVDRAYLRLVAAGDVWLQCQRCLAPYAQAVALDTTYRLVATEKEADEAPLDEDEADAIVGSAAFDVVDLVEEELLLSLPLVPKHAVCPQVHEALVTRPEAAPDETGASEARPNPFAVLAALKRGGDIGGGKA